MKKPEPPSVLIVDDHAQLRRHLRQLLEELGFRVVDVAGDGRSGVELAVEHAPDVVLMDLRMPGMGGLEATHEIKTRVPNTQVIILSAYEDPALVRGARDAGVYTYLVKGCAASLIENVITRAAALRRQLERSPTGPEAEA